MTPKPRPSREIKTPRRIGINEAQGSARDDEAPRRRILRRLVKRGGRLVEVNAPARETR